MMDLASGQHSPSGDPILISNTIGTKEMVVHIIDLLADVTVEIIPPEDAEKH